MMLPPSDPRGQRQWELDQLAQISKSGDEQVELAKVQLMGTAQLVAHAQMTNGMLLEVLRTATVLAETCSQQTDLLASIEYQTRSANENQQKQLDINRQMLELQQRETIRIQLERAATEHVHQCERLLDHVDQIKDPVAKVFWAKRQSEVLSETGMTTSRLPRLEDKRAFQAILTRLGTLGTSDGSQLNALISEYERQRSKAEQKQNHLFNGLPAVVPLLTLDESTLDKGGPQPPSDPKGRPIPTETVAKMRRLISRGLQEIGWSILVLFILGLVGVAYAITYQVKMWVILAGFAACWMSLSGIAAWVWLGVLQRRLASDANTKTLLVRMPGLRPARGLLGCPEYLKIIAELGRRMDRFEADQREWGASRARRRREAEIAIRKENLQRQANNEQREQELSKRRVKIEAVQSWLRAFHEQHPEMGPYSMAAVGK